MSITLCPPFHLQKPVHLLLSLSLSLPLSDKKAKTEYRSALPSSLQISPCNPKLRGRKKVGVLLPLYQSCPTMGSNVYSYNHHHHHHQQAVAESNNNGGRSCDRRSRSALPMLCSRNSTKDVVAVAVPIPARSSTPFSGGSGGSESEEPVSPKIGCMGQVKRNNRIGGFPAPAPASASSSYSSIAAKFHPPPLPAVKYLKLKRVFSARNLTTTSSERPNLVSKNGNVDADRRHKSSSSSSGKVAVNIEEIDPPLPVRSKRFEKEATQSEMSLWERRKSGRMGLKNLELQGIVPQQIPSSKFQPTTV